MQHLPPLVLSTSPRPRAAAGIRQSWLRCADLDPRLLADPDPMPLADLKLRIEAHRPLLGHAEPSLCALGSLADSTGSIVVLADPSGLILHERGNPAFLDKAQRVALQPGVSWAESRRGTNAIGTALHEGQAVAVHGGEHFLARNRILSCHAAPVFSARGEILGILDLTGPAATLCDYALPLVRRLARGIGNRLLSDSPLRRMVFHAGAQDASDAEPAILLLDDEARIAGANEAALQALDAGWQLIGTPWSQWIDGALRDGPGQWRRHDGRPLAGRLEAPARAARLAARSRPAQQPPRPADPPSLPEPDAAQRTLLRHGIQAIDAGLAVLLHGETGTGKEVLARHIHARSARRNGAFIAINCAALPEHLIESELFGYEAGAFTGARRDGARGLLRQAHQGILFLDEIGDMPLGLQTRLLRVLQEREVQPLGSEKRFPLDFGLISASHQDLQALVARGLFRADLYYRLQDMPLELPPLRQHPDLAGFVAGQYRLLGGRIHPDAAAALARHAWPGNYRELRSVLRRLRCQYPDQPAITPALLPAGLAAPPALPADAEAGAPPAGGPHDAVSRRMPQPPAPDTAAVRLRDLEQAAMRQALQDCGGNVSQAARRLGVHRSTLYRKLK
ncbi:MAG TPA: sigma-54-dependent Fis family transcriptional regulator [Castellaniella sp.]|nr:sigma-54-dependent Fis family transcriptional regulator [Castellaniella sp.]